MRNAIIRILQAIVIVAVAASFANAQDFVYFKKKAAAGGAACSSPSGHTFQEGWETPGYENANWIQSGTTIDNAVALLGTPPANACTYGIRFNVSAANAFAYRALSGFDNTSQIDIYFVMYITANTLDNNQNVVLLTINNSTTPAVSPRSRLLLYNNSGVYSLGGIGTSASTKETVVVDTWYYVHFRDLVGTGTNLINVSSASMDGGSNRTWNSTGASLPNYLHIGAQANLGAGESVDYYYGYIYY